MPGIKNIQADRNARSFSTTSSEWMLNPRLFRLINVIFKTTPNVDLFASRINKQIQVYYSYTPDPYAIAVDAFSENWKNYNFYAFPPYRFLVHTLQKIQYEQSTGTIIIPNWTTQIFFPIAMKLLIDFPILIKPKKRNLILPQNSNAVHPLHRKMGLLACRISGDPLKTKKFQKMLKHSSHIHGENQHRNNTMYTFKNVNRTVINGISIPFRLL